MDGMVYSANVFLTSLLPQSFFILHTAHHTHYCFRCCRFVLTNCWKIFQKIVHVFFETTPGSDLGPFGGSFLKFISSGICVNEHVEN